jgi:hypothetical protein
MYIPINICTQHCPHYWPDSGVFKLALALELVFLGGGASVIAKNGILTDRIKTISMQFQA